MKILDKITEMYQPQHQEKEYVISRVETYHDNPALMTLSIEVTAKPEVIEVLRKQLVGSAYRTLAESTEWRME